MPEAIEKEFSDIREIGLFIKNNNLDFVVEAHEPKNHKFGWSDGKTWMTISYESLKKRDPLIFEKVFGFPGTLNILTDLIRGNR
jgi:hypothetical protein